MRKFLIEVEVDEEKLKSVFNEDDNNSIEDRISIEMGWVTDSGIYVATIKEIK